MHEPPWQASKPHDCTSPPTEPSELHVCESSPTHTLCSPGSQSAHLPSVAEQTCGTLHDCVSAHAPARHSCTLLPTQRNWFGVLHDSPMPPPSGPPVWPFCVAGPQPPKETVEAIESAAASE